MISSVFYNFLSDELKDKIFKSLLFLFFSIYILKQTIFFNSQTIFISIRNLNNFLFFLNLSLLIFRFDCFIEILKRIKLRNALLTISSILLSLLVFSPSSLFLIDIIKIFIIFSISLSISKDFPRCIEIISDSISSTVLFSIFLSNFVIPDELISHGNWLKFSGGFINPNLPSLFLFSSIFGYFLINKRNKFFLVSAINFLLYFYLKIHSRTVTLSLIFLLLGSFIKNKIFYKVMRYISIAMSSLYFILFFSFRNFYNLIGINKILNFIDKTLSTRIYSLLSLDWQINKSDSIINLRNDYTPQIDSLYYELIRYLGLISLFFLVLFVLNRYYFKSYFYRPQFAVSIILISGFFEGLFYKITPIVLFLTCIILENCLLKNKLSKQRMDF